MTGVQTCALPILDEEEFTGAAARPASALADALAEEDDLYRDLNNS